MRYDIILAGFGGQGILFAGKILAHIGLLANKEVSWLPSYGPEMRGGTANCSVCLYDEPIGSPQVTRPNIFVAMNQPSYDKFIDKVKPNGTVIVDSTMVSHKSKREDINVCYVPATEIAQQNGLKGMANLVLLGQLFEMTKVISVEMAKKALEKTIPAKKKDLLGSNIQAFELGRTFGKKITA